MAWPIGPCPVSFLGFIYPNWASPLAVPPLSRASCPCPLETILAKVFSGRPEEVSGGCMLGILQDFIELIFGFPMVFILCQSDIY